MNRLAARCDAALDDLVSRGVSVNPIVRLETADGERLFEGARGEARPDKPGPTRPDHRFHLASIAKTMTAVLLLQLWEDGALGPDGLDAPYARFGVFTEPVLDRLHWRGPSPLARRITLRHLLTHTSGMLDAMIDDADVLGAPGPKSLIGRMLADPRLEQKAWGPWDPAHPDDDEAGVVNLYLANRLGNAALWPPGEAFHYSDTGFMILGLLIDKLTGQSYSAALRRWIFEPLGLTQTYLAYYDDPPDMDLARTEEAECWRGERPTLSTGASLSFDWAGGGVVSTAEELAIFFRALRQGRLFQSAATLHAMCAWRAPPKLAPPRIGIGLGVQRYDQQGVVNWGHAGAWGAKMFQDEETGVVVTGSLNKSRVEPDWHVAFLKAARDSGVGYTRSDT